MPLEVRHARIKEALRQVQSPNLLCRYSETRNPQKKFERKTVLTQQGWPEAPGIGVIIAQSAAD